MRRGPNSLSRGEVRHENDAVHHDAALQPGDRRVLRHLVQPQPLNRRHNAGDPSRSRAHDDRQSRRGDERADAGSSPLGAVATVRWCAAIDGEVAAGRK